ncbi:MAG TPA: SHOCT domain-containing protein [Caulobacteraceae bacterium]|nr:SHOCT domain-containing protein [Caulobacteraceae bacterium]
MSDAGKAPDQGASGARGQLQSLLVPGEAVVAFAMEHRLYALLHSRHVAAATSGRVIYFKRPLLGGFDPLSIRMQDIKEAAIKVGMFTATVTITYSANMSDTAVDEGETMVLTIASLKKEPAAELYRVCQEQDQAWREKRRVRSMEEMRARSGGVQIAAGIMPGAAAVPPQPALPGAETGPSQRLAHAKDLLDQHLITDAEYQEIKAKIIAGL